ncbi:MAG: hypothetical protein Q9224_007411, partial [Gallowayella concinna]
MPNNYFFPQYYQDPFPTMGPDGVEYTTFHHENYDDVSEQWPGAVAPTEPYEYRGYETALDTGNNMPVDFTLLIGAIIIAHTLDEHRKNEGEVIGYILSIDDGMTICLRFEFIHDKSSPDERTEWFAAGEKDIIVLELIH